MMDFMSLPELDFSFFIFSPDGNQLDVYYQGEKIKEKKIKQAENAYVILTHRES